jgi:hypothetical protein
MNSGTTTSTRRGSILKYRINIYKPQRREVSRARGEKEWRRVQDPRERQDPHTHFGGTAHSVHLPVVFEVDMGRLFHIRAVHCVISEKMK